MGKKKKAEHYVPQCYLKRWTQKQSNQVYVYNKKENKYHISNIHDVASERYFYDIDLSKIISKETFKSLGIELDPKQLSDEQFIENFFANELEKDLDERLSRIINRVLEMNSWEIRNCYFISEYDKLALSVHLAFQRIRTKETRQNIIDSNLCVVDWLKDLGASEKSIKKHTIPESRIKAIHGKMILNEKHIDTLSKIFHNYTWTLAINRTAELFYTSDNPICSIAHKTHPILSMSGFESPGVEVIIPFSPELLLVMCDGNYHKGMLQHERKIIEVDNIKTIEHYNSVVAQYSTRFVISKDNNFSIIKKMLDNNPNVFNKPHTTLTWGDKIYQPNK